MLEDDELSIIARALNLRRDRLSWYDQAKFLDLDIDALALCLHDLNFRAVRERYDGRHDVMPDVFRYEGGGFAGLDNDRKFYRELSRLIYQCSEGDVVEDPLYVFLLNCKHEVADQIIRALDDPQVVTRKCVRAQVQP